MPAPVVTGCPEGGLQPEAKGRGTSIGIDHIAVGCHRILDRRERIAAVAQQLADSRSGCSEPSVVPWQTASTVKPHSWAGCRILVSIRKRHLRPRALRTCHGGLLLWRGVLPGSAQRVGGGVVEHDGHDRRLEGDCSLDRQIDRGRCFCLDPIAKPAEGAVGGESRADRRDQRVKSCGTIICALNDYLQLRPMLEVVAQRRQRDLRFARLAVAQNDQSGGGMRSGKTSSRKAVAASGWSRACSAARWFRVWWACVT